MSKPLRVAFVGLDADLACELKPILAQYDIVECPRAGAGACASEIADLSPDVVFCGSARVSRETALRAVAISRPWTPVIVASRQPETSEWLDALEAGASDYCSAPFESHQIEWILDSTCRRTRTAAA